MWGMIGDEDGKGFVAVLIDKLHGLPSLGVGFPVSVELLGFAVLTPVKGVCGVKEERAVIDEKFVIKAVSVGAWGNAPFSVSAIEVPFAVVTGVVAGVAKDFREVGAVTGKNLEIVLNGTGAKRVLSGEEHSAVGSADGGI